MLIDLNNFFTPLTFITEMKLMYWQSIIELMCNQENRIFHKFFCLFLCVFLQIFLFTFVRDIFHNVQSFLKIEIIILIQRVIPSNREVLFLAIKPINITLLLHLRHVWWLWFALLLFIIDYFVTQKYLELLLDAF